MEPFPPLSRFQRPQEHLPEEYRHLIPVRNEQLGCMKFEFMVTAFMLGGSIGGPFTLLFGPDVTRFIIGTIIGGILAMGVLWEPTCRMLARAENDPEEFERLQKKLDSIDDFG